MRDLKWGLSRTGSRLYTSFKDAVEILGDKSSNDPRSRDPRNLLGAVVFKAYSDVEAETPHDEDLSLAESAGYISKIQIDVGKILHQKRARIHSITSPKNAILIQRDLDRIIEEAVDVTQLTNPSEVLSAFYDIRKKYGDKSFEAMGNVVNRMTDHYSQELRSYVQQAELLKKLLSEK